jgi:hypothetical protein
LIFPFGVTLHVCVALPPDAVVAITVNAFAALDSACVGVHVIVLPASEAPTGPLLSAYVTALLSAELAAT